jgi:hypothetical protein
LNVQTAAPADTPVAAEPPRETEYLPRTWAERWLGTAASPSWVGEAQRLLLAAGLACLFGAALGLRSGGGTIALAAIGAPTGIVAVAAVAVPAFAIVLALANAPLDLTDLAHATSRAAMRAGFFLAGLAPGAALLVVTCEDAITVSIAGFGALYLAGAIAAHSFARDLRPRFAAAPPATRAVLGVALPTFLLFAAILAARVWWLALPMLTEAS